MKKEVSNSVLLSLIINEPVLEMGVLSEAQRDMFWIHTCCISVGIYMSQVEYHLEIIN